VFDGDLYRDFHVCELGLFEDPHDVALHLSLDGVDLTTGKIKHQVSVFSKLSTPTRSLFPPPSINAIMITPCNSNQSTNNT
jgi:hypothetical protein